MKFLDEFILKIVLKGLLPIEIKAKFSDSEKFNQLVIFVRIAIRSSVLYVKGPEIFLRLFLFLVIIALQLLEIITFKRLSVEGALQYLANSHPLVGDGIRLYLLLAMFAAFEDESMRRSHGFLSFSDLSNTFAK